MNRLFNRKRRKIIQEEVKPLEQEQPKKEAPKIKVNHKIKKPIEQEGFENLVLSKRQYQVLKLMREHPDWRQIDIAKEMNITQGKVSALMKSIKRNYPHLAHEFVLFNKSLDYNYYQLKKFEINPQNDDKG